MEVLIVSKTHMTNNACVGGLVLDNNRYIRLLNPGNQNQPTNTDFEIGQVWNIRFITRNPLTPPHVEDIIVLEKRLLKIQTNLSDFITDRLLIDWNEHIENLFDGLLSWTTGGSGYIDSKQNPPVKSVGFWISNKDLRCYTSFDNHRYRYNENRNLKFVGYQTPIDIIPAGTIIRVSLTRNFQTNGVEGCWLQLSGWYMD